MRAPHRDELPSTTGAELPKRLNGGGGVAPAVAGDDPAAWMRWLVLGVCCLVGALIVVGLAGRPA